MKPDISKSAILTTINIPTEITQLKRWAAGLVFGLVGVILLWTLAASISGAVIASGFLRIEKRIHAVQHPEGGLIKKVSVSEGEHVVRGQVLIELDDVDASAAGMELRAQLDAETARLARLEAEQKARNRVTYPPELTDRLSDQRVSALIANENAVFNSRVALQNEQRRRLKEQRAALQNEIVNWGHQVEATDRSLLLLSKQEQMAKTLAEKNFFSETHLIDSRRAISEKEEKKYEAASYQAQAQQRVGDVALRLEALDANYHAEVARDLNESQIKLSVLQERIKPVSSALERRLIRAPVDGKVNLLKAGNPGGVIPPRETAVELVPDEATLTGEVRISPADISEVHINQHVDVELSGLNRRTTPLVEGRNSSVSSDILSDPANPAIRYFNVRIELNSKKAEVPLSAGMPVVSYIRTHERSPIELWLDPVLGALRHSLRER